VSVKKNGEIVLSSFQAPNHRHVTDSQQQQWATTDPLRTYWLLSSVSFLSIIPLAYVCPNSLVYRAPPKLLHLLNRPASRPSLDNKLFHLWATAKWRFRAVAFWATTVSERHSVWTITFWPTTIPKRLCVRTTIFWTINFITGSSVSILSIIDFRSLWSNEHRNLSIR